MYLFKITANYTDKNKLYAALHDHAKSIDSTLINSKEDLAVFWKELQSRVKELNEENSRCKPIELQRFHHDDVNETIWVHGSWHATVYKVIHEYNEEETRTERNSNVVASFMEHCKTWGFELPDSVFESYFGA